MEAQRFLVENMSDGVYFVDLDRTIVGWNRGATVLSGFAAADVVGRRCQDGILNHMNTAGLLLCRSGCPLAAVMADGTARRMTVWMSRADGTRMPVRVQATPVRDARGEIVGAMELFSADVPARHVGDRADQVRRAGNVDERTGLGDDRYLAAELRAWRGNWVRHGWPFGVLLVGLGDPVGIAEQHGASAVEAAIRLVAGTMLQTLPGSAVVTREREHRLVALVPCADAADLADTVAEVATMLGASRMVIDGRRVPVPVIVGHAMIADGDDAGTLVHRVACDLQPVPIVEAEVTDCAVPALRT